MTTFQFNFYKFTKYNMKIKMKMVYLLCLLL